MSCCGGGRVGADGGGQKPTLAPSGTHPRYIPRRGAVLKRIVTGTLRFFLSQTNAIVPESAVAIGGRVSPAPQGILGGADGAAEQGK